MSRWLLALLFAFGSVTFLTGCPAAEEEETTEETTEEGTEEEGTEEEGGEEEGGEEETTE
ncbi:MAG: hypothetical protein AAF085_08260 [Planctomycetota bacterium]